MTKSLNIFEFSHYRDYLKAWIEEAKRTKSFNLTRLADVAQVHSTFLSHVLKGAKDLSFEQAALVCDHIGHSKLEQDYFFILIHLDRAGNSKLRQYWQDKKQQIEQEKNKLNQRFEKHRQLTDGQRVAFYSSWIYVAIWTSTAIAGGQTLTQIADRFRITRSKTEEIMAFLVQSGLCNVQKGLYTMGEVHVHVPNESPFVVKHHTNWRVKSMQRMDFREPTELFFTGPMSISRKDFEILREKLNGLIKEVVKVASASDAEELACLNIDFFRAIT